MTRYINLKTNYGVETVDQLDRHAYAPELNKLHFKDGTVKNVPGCDTIYKAVGL